MQGSDRPAAPHLCCCRRSIAHVDTDLLPLLFHCCSAMGQRLANVFLPWKERLAARPVGGRRAGHRVAALAELGPRTLRAALCSLGEGRPWHLARCVPPTVLPLPICTPSAAAQRHRGAQRVCAPAQGGHGCQPGPGRQGLSGPGACRRRLGRHWAHGKRRRIGQRVMSHSLARDCRLHRSRQQVMQDRRHAGTGAGGTRLRLSEQRQVTVLACTARAICVPGSVGHACVCLHC